MKNPSKNNIILFSALVIIILAVLFTPNIKNITGKAVVINTNALGGEAFCSSEDVAVGGVSNPSGTSYWLDSLICNSSIIKAAQTQKRYLPVSVEEFCESGEVVCGYQNSIYNPSGMRTLACCKTLNIQQKINLTSKRLLTPTAKNQQLNCELGEVVCGYKDTCMSGSYTETCYINRLYCCESLCTPTAEICDNLADEDCDGLIDSDDPDCAVLPECTDDDGGENYYVKGTVTASNWGTSFDSCFGLNSISINELYCENGVAKEAQYVCPNGCQDGACVLGPDESFMKVNDIVTIRGKKVTLLNVGSGGSIIIDIDGLIDTILAASTKVVNGLEITNIETHYSNLKLDRSAVLKISALVICTDTDGGENIYTKGVTSAGLLREEDKCANSGLLVEQFCQEWDGVRYDAGVSTPLNNPYGVYGTTITPVGISSNSATFKVGSETATINVGQYKIFSSGIIVKLDSVAQPNSLGYQVANLYFRKTNERCPNGCLDGACILNTDEYHLMVDQEISVDGKLIKLLNVGSAGSVIVDVDGVVSTINPDGTEVINDIEITVIETYYYDTKEQRSAVLKIVPAVIPPLACTDSDGGKNYYERGTKIDKCGTGTDACINEALLLEYNCLEDKNECGYGFNYNCPNGCQDGACIVPSDVTFLPVTIEYVDDLDLSDVGLSLTEKAVHIFAPGNDRFLLPSPNLYTSELWLVVVNDQVKVYYKNVEKVPDIALAFSTPLEESNIGHFAFITYQDSQIDLLFNYMSTSSRLQVYIAKEYANEYLSAGFLINGLKKLTCLGTYASLEEKDEVVWVDGNLLEKSVNNGFFIGTRTADFITNYGIKVKTPATNGALDQVVLEIPSYSLETPPEVITEEIECPSKFCPYTTEDDLQVCVSLGIRVPDTNKDNTDEYCDGDFLINQKSQPEHCTANYQCKSNICSIDSQCIDYSTLRQLYCWVLEQTTLLSSMGYTTENECLAA